MAQPKKSSSITEGRRSLRRILVSLGFLGGMALALAALSPPGQFPQSLVQWDSIHYLDIAKRGYQVPEAWIEGARRDGGKVSQFATGSSVHDREANAGFFPAFPILVRAVAILGTWGSREGVISLPGEGQKKAGPYEKTKDQALEWIALGVAWLALIGAMIFWIFLGRVGSEAEGRSPIGEVGWHWALVGLLIQPVSFFLFAAYTESLFTFALMGFFLSLLTLRLPSGRSRALPAMGVIGFGTLLTSTRLFGVACVFAALGDWWVQRIKKRGSLLELGALSASFLGALAFFAYCHVRFGEWDLYFRLQEAGWKNYPDFLFLFKPWTYLPALFFEDTWVSLSKVAIPFSAGVSGWLFLRLGQRDLGMQLAALLMIYLVGAGKARENMDSVIRYMIPVWWLQWSLILREGKGLKAGFEKTKNSSFLKLGITLLFGVLLVLQAWLAFRFLRGRWVA